VKPNAPADLSSLRTEIDAWRATRKGRAHMPAYLWDAAVALVGPLPITRVARELGLNRDRLRARVARGVEGAPPPAGRSSPAFVEVGAADLARISSRLPVARIAQQSPAPQASAVRVLLERPDGAKLSLDLSSTEWSHLEALCSSFLRA
jgi:hypothetical protein